MIRRLFAEVIEGVIGPLPESPRRTDLRDAARTAAVRRARPLPADESAPRPPRRTPVQAEPVPPPVGPALGLDSRAELCRAFLLIEILGPPVALRDQAVSRQPSAVSRQDSAPTTEH